MAQGFTATLSEPQMPAGSGPINDATVGGAVGKAIGGLGKAAFDIFDAIDNNNKSDAGDDLQKQLYSEVQTYSGSSQAPALVGQSSDDAQTNAAQSSPVVQSAVSRINTMADSHAQGNMSSAAFAARTAAIVQQAKMAHPRYGDYLEGVARNVLGWSPTQEQVAIETQDQNTVKQSQQAVRQSFINAAVLSGVGYFNPDSTPDLDSTAKAGQTILQTKAQLEATTANVDLQIKQLQLAKAQGGPDLSEADRSDLEYRGILKATLPSFNEHAGAMLSQVPAAIDRLKKSGLKGPELQTAIQNEINQTEAKWNTDFNQNLNGLQNPPSSKAVSDSRAYYKAQFDTWRSYYGGNLDDAAVKTRAASILKNNNDINYHKSAPVLTGLNDVFGPSAIGPMVNQAIAVGTPGYNTAQREAASITQNQPQPADAADHLQSATHVASGQTTLNDYPQGQRKQVLSTMLSGYDTFVKDPNKLTDKQLDGYGNMATNIVSQGLQGSSNDIIAAAGHTNSPSSLVTFDRYASSSQDASKVDTLAKGIITLNAQSLVTQYKNIKPQTLTTGNPGGNPGGPLADSNAKIGPYSFSKSTYSPVYNPQTGQIEIQSQRSGGRSDYAPVPVDMQRSVASMNASLGAIVHLKNHSDDLSKSLNDRQLKQAYIQQIGIPMKSGVAPVPMPGDEKTNTGGKQSAASPFDFTNQYNTKLDADQEKQFQVWLNKTGRQGDLSDYDLRGAWLEGAKQAGNGHFTDKFKKPNHPTFSDESIYNGVDGNRGGKWVDQGNDHWSFQAAPGNLKYRSKDELQNYFNTREKGSTLVLPSQQSGADIHKVQNVIESNNNPNAVSSKGAKGINQVMDATNRDPGFGVTPAKDNSPAERERVGRDYVDALTKHYNGNTAYALVAYNWGPGNADKWVANGARWADLPNETQEYLQRALLEGRKQQASMNSENQNG